MYVLKNYEYLICYSDFNSVKNCNSFSTITPTYAHQYWPRVH